MPAPLIEVCVDTADGLAAAIEGGADRIELCAALSVGGLTPSRGLMATAAASPVPVFAMIRPRDGDFVYATRDIAVMLADIDAARDAGLAGVVFGANLPDGRLDVVLLRDLIAAAQGMGQTLHRAFDLAPDLDRALEDAIALGLPRILTSGGAATAIEGATVLQRLIARAAGRIAIMPGSGINARTVGVLRHLPLSEIHASCAVERPVAHGAVALGFSGPMRRETDAAEVRALRAALAG
jgi:copper homeostasis protein